MKAGTTSVDAGKGLMKAGTTSVDTGKGLMMAGTTSVDAGKGLMMAGTTSVDAGKGLMKAGTTSVDAGKDELKDEMVVLQIMINEGLRYTEDSLWHESSKTTEIYTHITKKGIDKLQSPLDSLEI